MFAHRLLLPGLCILHPAQLVESLHSIKTIAWKHKFNDSDDGCWKQIGRWWLLDLLTAENIIKSFQNLKIYIWNFEFEKYKQNLLTANWQSMYANSSSDSSTQLSSLEMTNSSVWSLVHGPTVPDSLSVLVPTATAPHPLEPGPSPSTARPPGPTILIKADLGSLSECQ